MEERLGEMRKGRRERIEKGSHCFFKSSGYDKLELKHKNLVFFKLIEGCLYSLDWTTGLTFELTFERFSFQLL